ncbi:sodium:solute symporter, partial [Streptomyces roseolus]
SAEFPGIGVLGYIGLSLFVLYVVVSVVLPFVLKAVKAPEGVDETSPSDYTADAGDTGVRPLPKVGAGH